MTYKAKYGKFYENVIVSNTTNVCVGDIVKITDIGKVFPNYEKAYNAVWNDKHKITRNWDESERTWKVIGFVAHEHPSYGILVGLQARNFERTIVSVKCIKIVRKKIKDTCVEVDVKTIQSSFTNCNSPSFTRSYQ